MRFSASGIFFAHCAGLTKTAKIRAFFLRMEAVQTLILTLHIMKLF